MAAKPSQPVAGKVVLITGAARGIGAEAARRLAGRGARVVLVGLEPELLERTAAECGPEAAWFEADVTDRAAVEAAVTGAAERFGGIDVAIANAGIAAGGTFRTMDAASWERIVEVNLLGAVRTLRACLPHVVERRGYVLAVASVAAALHPPVLSAYAASKAGIEAFADSLRGEVRHLGVDVGVAYFHWIDTDMVAGADDQMPEAAQRRKLAPGVLGKTYPVSDAGEAVVRGVERRTRWIVAPGWVRALLLLRGVLGAAVDAGSRRDAPEVIGALEAEAAARGEDAYRPTGAGGAADVAARERG